MNANTLLKVPLFPLRHVVLPGEILPLHIQEERYKELVKDCTQKGLGPMSAPFGVSLAGPEGIHQMGCTLAIKDITKRYPDGSFDILAEGRSRFRLDTLIHQRPYFEAAIELIPEEEQDVDDLLTEEVKRKHGELAEFLGAHCALPENTGEYLSFASAVALGLDSEQRQILLSLESENTRLEWLESLYSKMHQVLADSGGGCTEVALLVANPGMKLVH